MAFKLFRSRARQQTGLWRANQQVALYCAQTIESLFACIALCLTSAKSPVHNPPTCTRTPHLVHRRRRRRSSRRHTTIGAFAYRSALALETNRRRYNYLIY
eukprot:1347825-Amphidinium_carterae.1